MHIVLWNHIGNFFSDLGLGLAGSLTIYSRVITVFTIFDLFQIAPDNLKRGNVVRFSDEGLSGKSSVNNLAVGSSSKSLTSSSGNAALTLSDYMKESKTLNVNVLAEEDEEMNNEIR